MDLYKKVKIANYVTYINEIGQRVPVPLGYCEFSDNNGLGPFILRWQKDEVTHSIELSDIEYSQYSRDGHIKFQE